jgi:S-adenosylmethionine-diacylgycerolhomoserine-N-methlytransferase
MEHLERYYRFQSTIYDATRWLFLFGREAILGEIRRVHPGAVEIVEIGCGTGRNLERLALIFPEARITGIDLSPDMLARAEARTARFGRRVVLQRRIQQGGLPTRPDVILCSYSLSMMNPGGNELIAAAAASLAPSGILAVVDFHDTPAGWFRAHMGRHHVRMDAQLLPALASALQPERVVIRRAYAGLWRYLSFVGRNAPPASSSGGP